MIFEWFGVCPLSSFDEPGIEFIVSTFFPLFVSSTFSSIPISLRYLIIDVARPALIYTTTLTVFPLHIASKKNNDPLPARSLPYVILHMQVPPTRICNGYDAYVTQFVIIVWTMPINRMFSIPRADEISITHTKIVSTVFARW